MKVVILASGFGNRLALSGAVGASHHTRVKACSGKREYLAI
jgi:hypothetical protein